MQTWILFVALAAVCNAVMDSIESEHVYGTIFKNMRPEFWHKRNSWDKSKVIGKWKFDGWHIFKSMMLVFYFLSIVVYVQIVHWAIDIAIATGVWTLIFNLFYNQILKKRNH